MIVNPVRQPELLRTYSGSRMLRHEFNLVGTSIQDPLQPERIWTIQNLFRPLPRYLGGIRARCTDQKDFVTFIDQLSLELLLGHARPGEDCIWADCTYPEPGGFNYYGFCCDSEDLKDDMHARELLLLAERRLIPGIELYRRAHIDVNNDVIDEFLLESDAGSPPNPQLVNVNCRWLRGEREKVIWSHI